MTPSKQSTTSMAEAATAKGMSRFMERGVTVIGATIAVRPVMSSTLNVLEPTTLPTAMPGLCLSAETSDTKNSGIDVPMATTVRPMTNCDMPVREAMPAAPSVRSPALHNTRAMPTITSNT